MPQTSPRIMERVTTRPAFRHKYFKKDEFLWCQIQDLAGPESLTSEQIQFEIEHSQASGLGDRRAVSLYQIAQPCKQFGKSKGLGQVIVATLFEPSHTVIYRTPCRKDEHRCA
jgi:hypothetical protein